MMISLVVAVSQNGVIGRDGGLAWRLSTDLQQFKAITMGKPIIMGRKTWDGLPRKPLPGRLNIVVTRNRDFECDGAVVASTAEAALTAARHTSPDEICIIGGGEIYRIFLPFADRIYLTEVHMSVDGDTRFPALDPSAWQEVSRENFEKGERDDAGFTVRILQRIRSGAEVKTN